MSLAHEDTMQGYYRKRAPVYDRVYAYPERQSDLRWLEEEIPSLLSGRRVLEVAAGTGYWTRFISRRAELICATDGAAETLGQVSARDLGCPVSTQVADAYELAGVEGAFSGAFAGLWFSHVPVSRRGEWFTALHARLQPGAQVVLIDNSQAQCLRLPLTRRDDQGNSYQTRETDDGQQYEVLKNFPTEVELLDLVEDTAKPASCRYVSLEHFWLFAYELAARD